MILMGRYCSEGARTRSAHVLPETFAHGPMFFRLARMLCSAWCLGSIHAATRVMSACSRKATEFHRSCIELR